ncbi:ubiquitin-like small modifier protein 1 [Thermococcus sibiricus]|uniref:Putative molybdopterin converting factor, subunit 1 n=1 Tax=Thermococcus sibiricus (strain DSM 12597 / MM 739) TaxID=604354 RepID=C6A369_THESM|nr:ubiquitin-like small modifier protein 1 [Thermococcus sibiricus]ACS90064.1 Putative molybdopterin converting factor, subunit 1 [Thermococcus sibiricus MM 739]
MVRVRFFATLRNIVRKNELELQANTVGELLEKLYSKYPKIEKELEKGVVILVNGKNIEHLEKLNTKLKDEDLVSIFPPVGGG